MPIAAAAAGRTKRTAMAREEITRQGPKARPPLPLPKLRDGASRHPAAAVRMPTSIHPPVWPGHPFGDAAGPPRRRTYDGAVSAWDARASSLPSQKWQAGAVACGIGAGGGSPSAARQAWESTTRSSFGSHFVIVQTPSGWSVRRRRGSGGTRSRSAPAPVWACDFRSYAFPQYRIAACEQVSR